VEDNCAVNLAWLAGSTEYCPARYNGSYANKRTLSNRRKSIASDALLLEENESISTSVTSQ
jgi:hypothetical protein